MLKKVLHVVALVLVAGGAVGVAQAQAPRDGIYITDEEIKAVLKFAADTKRTIPDNTIRVIDMGTYQLGVAVIHRGRLGGGANAAAAGRGAAPTPAPAPNPQPACGEARTGAKGPNGLYHDDTAETYVVISGAATLITGGTIVNGRRSAADSEVTTILNGPSCSGTMVGFTTRDVKTGDIIVIPEGVPHGFAAVPDHVTYLSVRPDLKKVLQRGYVNPGLKAR